jgi:hypothetical protein
MKRRKMRPNVAVADDSALGKVINETIYDSTFIQETRSDTYPLHADLRENIRIFNLLLVLHFCILPHRLIM